MDELIDNLFTSKLYQQCRKSFLFLRQISRIKLKILYLYEVQRKPYQYGGVCRFNKAGRCTFLHAGDPIQYFSYQYRQKVAAAAEKEAMLVDNNSELKNSSDNLSKLILERLNRGGAVIDRDEQIIVASVDNLCQKFSWN